MDNNIILKEIHDCFNHISFLLEKILAIQESLDYFQSSAPSTIDFTNDLHFLPQIAQHIRKIIINSQCAEEKLCKSQCELAQLHQHFQQQQTDLENYKRRCSQLQRENYDLQLRLLQLQNSSADICSPLENLQLSDK